jgi:hypothetical protein
MNCMFYFNTLAIALLAAPLAAQEGIPDPFDKKQAPPPAMQAEAGPPEVLGVRLVAESYRVQATWFAALMAQGKTDAELYDKVLDEAGREEARVVLTDLQSITSEPGHRAKVESHDEVITPGGFNAEHPPGFEGVAIGDMLEMESVIASDGIGVHLNLALEHSRLSGFYPLRKSGDEIDRVTPKIEQRLINNSATLDSGKTALMGVTPETSESADSHLVASFLTPLLLNNDKASLIVEGRWQMALTAWSLDAVEARRLIATHRVDDETLLRETRRSGQLETLLTAECHSGQRVAVASHGKLTYGTWLASSSQWSSLATRELGGRVEFDPVLSNDRDRAQVSVRIENGAFRGDWRGHDALARAPSQPVFATRRLLSTAMVLAGQPRFVGTLNEPGGTGVNERQPSGKVSLVFLELRLP